MADMCVPLEIDTGAENRQSVKKQVLQIRRQYVFQSDTKVIAWEAMWHVFLIFWW